MMFSQNLTVEYGNVIIRRIVLTDVNNAVVRFEGVSHFDEIFLMFSVPLLPLILPSDKQASDNLLDLWTSFALTG